MPYTYPFTLPPLSYDYSSLEPYIDTETMLYHHDKHFKSYIENLNSILEKHPALQKMTLTQLLTTDLSSLPCGEQTGIFNNAGGVYNHALFFDGLAPAEAGRHRPRGALAAAIERSFGSLDELKDELSRLSLGVFGSGWGCLALTPGGELRLLSLKNQETSLSYGAQSILLIDVWEHAYYLKYRNNRKTYIENIWNVLTFPEI